MIDKVEGIIRDAKRIAEVIKSFSGQIRVISHYDCDGICSAAIIAKALAREEKPFRLGFVKKLSTGKISEIAAEGNGMVIFTDLGSGNLDTIQQELLKGGTIVIISDHHNVKGEILPEHSKELLHINPVNYGINENISGSGITYMLARAIGQHNRDLSEIAIIGAIGDSQMGSIGPDWGLLGLNSEILKDAQAENKISVEKGLRLWGRYTRPLHKALQYSVDPYLPGITGSESASIQFLQETGITPKEGDRWRTISDLSDEEIQRLATAMIKERIKNGHENPDWIFGDVYDLIDKKEDFRDANEFATMLNACGKLRKEYLGVALCLNNVEVYDEVRESLEGYRKEIGKAVGWLYRNRENAPVFMEKEYGIYVLASGNIPEDFLSNAVSILSKSDSLPPEKPVIAMTDTEEGDLKISARLNDEVTALNLNDVISEAVEALGGEGGGHQHAAGGNIPKGSEQTFINSMEEILKKTLKPVSSKDEKLEDIKSNGLKDTIEVKDHGEEAASSATGAGRNQEMEGKGLVRYFNSKDV